MSTWKTKVLADLVYFNPESIGKKYNYKQIHYLDISSVGTGVADFKNVIVINVAPSRAKRIVKPNDTIIATVRPVNRSFYYLNNFPENTIVSTGFAVLRPKADLINSRFLFYVISNETFTSFLVANEQGANYPAVTPEIIGRAEIILPPLKTQKRIASILSAYDDLIENNSKRIKLIEEIAQRTYEEWFVKFRVNGEQLSIDEATGLPVGWKQITVNDYAEVIGKGPSLNYDFQGQKYPVINQSCVRNGEIELEKVLYAQELNANKEYCYLKTNDILINSMGQGTLGRVSKNVSIRNERFIIHNCITFLRAKKELSQFQLYYFISSKQSYFISVSQGSTGQTTLKQSLVGDLEINLPTNSILNSFNNIIEPIWNQMGVLKNQNSSLKQSRDILLSRLMSGTINVES